MLFRLPSRDQNCSAACRKPLLGCGKRDNAIDIDEDELHVASSQRDAPAFR